MTTWLPRFFPLAVYVPVNKAPQGPAKWVAEFLKIGTEDGDQAALVNNQPLSSVDLALSFLEERYLHLVQRLSLGG